MKKQFWLIGLIAFFCPLFMDGFSVLISSEPLSYFSQDKSRLLVVAAIGVMGGLIANAYYKLSLRNRHRVVLFTLGSAACFLTIFAGYLSFGFFSLVRQIEGQIEPSQLGLVGIVRGFYFLPLFPLAASLFLWVLLVRNFKRHVE